MNPFIAPLRVAIVGSRGFAELDQVRAYVARLHRGCTVVSGGARGVDHVAEVTARRCGLAVEVFLPDWAQHGRRAGIVRNRSIVERAEYVAAFWDGASPGTRNSIDLAKQLRRPLEVVVASEAKPRFLGWDLRR